MTNCCTSEFRLANFGFTGVTPKQFYVTQWSDSHLLHFSYRMLLALLTLSWTIADLVINIPTDGGEFFHFISNLTNILVTIYFMVAFVVSTVGLVKYTVQGKTTESFEQDELSWYHKLQWVLFTMAISSISQVTISFWALDAPTKTPEEIFTPIGLYIHAVVVLLCLLDLFMDAFPIRLLHFVYAFLFVFAYGVLNLSLYWSGANGAVYSVLDWDNNTGLAAGILAGVVFVMPVVLQPVFFGLYHVRVAIYKRVVQPETSSGEKSGAENLGFDSTKM